jgi:hypothetical protein
MRFLCERMYDGTVTKNRLALETARKMTAPPFGEWPRVRVAKMTPRSRLIHLCDILETGNQS